MKIAYIVPYIAQSGPLNVVKHLCMELKENHDVDVYYLKAIRKVSFPVGTRRISFFQKIDFEHYDIIHSHGVLPDAYVWWHRKNITNARTITTLHNYVKEDFRYAYNPVKAFLLERMWNVVTSRHDVVVALSQDAVKYYRSFWKNRNLSYVYNGIPPVGEEGRKGKIVSGRDHGKIRIGLIGSGDITKRKGFDQVIKALPSLSKYSLYIAGEGREIDSLKKLSLSLGVADRVHFVGFQKDITTFIEEMDLFCVPSLSEGFSLGLQEIIRQKKPVVCSRIPIFMELFSSNEVAFFNLHDIEELAKSIMKVTSKKEEYVDKAYRKYLACYTASHMAENYLKLYEEQIRKRRG